MATTVDDVADYIIVKLDAAKVSLSILKLQKLTYYAQAWHLALTGRRLFEGRFQAWVHGPVNRSIYDRFAATHMMYDMLGPSDIRRDFDLQAIPEEDRVHIDEILEAYARFSGPQLESMTHADEPWIRARGSLKPSERCETEIDEKTMASFYKRLLEEAEA